MNGWKEKMCEVTTIHFILNLASGTPKIHGDIV